MTIIDTDVSKSHRKIVLGLKWQITDYAVLPGDCTFYSCCSRDIRIYLSNAKI